MTYCIMILANVGLFSFHFKFLHKSCLFLSFAHFIFITCAHLDDGYRLTSLGYDYLAIKNLVDRGVFVEIGLQIGEGKESGT